MLRTPTKLALAVLASRVAQDAAALSLENTIGDWAAADEADRSTFAEVLAARGQALRPGITAPYFKSCIDMLAGNERLRQYRIMTAASACVRSFEDQG